MKLLASRELLFSSPVVSGIASAEVSVGKENANVALDPSLCRIPTDEMTKVQRVE